MDPEIEVRFLMNRWVCDRRNQRRMLYDLSMLYMHTQCITHTFIPTHYMHTHTYTPTQAHMFTHIYTVNTEADTNTLKLAQTCERQGQRRMFHE